MTQQERPANDITEHQASMLLTEGQTEYQNQLLQKQLDYEEVINDDEIAQAELSAIVGDADETARHETPKTTNRRYAIKNVTSYFDSILAKFCIVGSIIMLIVGAVILPAIDGAMFYDLFKSNFEDQFGQVSAAEQWLTFLFAAQALAAMIAIKMFATTPKRISALTAVMFVCAALLLVGAVLNHAQTQAEREQLQTGSEAGFSWDDPAQTTPEENTTNDSQILAIYFTALGFIILPIAGALLISAGWNGLINSTVKARTASYYRRAYRSRKTVLKRKAALEIELHDLASRKHTIVRTPLNAEVSFNISTAQSEMRAVRTAHQSGLSALLPPKSPANAEHRITDLPKAETEANETIARLGNGFANKQHERWSGKDSDEPPL